MAAKLKAAPKATLQGVHDLSGGVLPVTPEQIPTHLPHIFSYMQKGPTYPQLVVGNSMVNMYGSESFDYRGAYANHQTVLINKVNANGNSMVLQRMKPADANDNARLMLSLEVVPAEITVYDRNADGSYMLDANGDPIPTDPAATVTGYRARWLVSAPVTVMGQAVISAGSIVVDSVPTVSAIYPIFEFEVSHFGAYGNNQGLRLWAPSTTTNPPINDSVVDEQDSFIYRLQFIERASTNVQPTVVETRGGSQSIEFSLKEGAINTAVDQELFIDTVVLDAYRDLETLPNAYGPFNNLSTYHDNITTVLDLFHATEATFQTDWPQVAADGRHMVNIVNAKDVNGNPYHSLQIDGSTLGGVDLTTYSNHYAAGGSDGTMDIASFDALVAAECADWQWMDSAEWPQSVIYDTGFTLATKKELLKPMGARKDMFVFLSTQDISEPQNTAEQETSMAIALRTAAAMYPESEVFGTPVCRAAVIGHSGYLINSQYKGLLPLTVQLAEMCSKFMGAGNGIWKRDRGFDIAPYNQVSIFKDVNVTYKYQTVYENDWDNGLVWVQKFDRSSLFFPGLQTVYSDSTSVLNSIINAFIVVETEKVAERTWRQLTGGSKLTKDQFIERSDKLIDSMLAGRFDDRVVAVPKTYFTEYDAELGYAWATDITLYLNNMMLVGTYTIISKRRSDFAS